MKGSGIFFQDGTGLEVIPQPLYSPPGQVDSRNTTPCRNSDLTSASLHTPLGP